VTALQIVEQGVDDVVRLEKAGASRPDLRDEERP
jgi:hypothetical protein